MAYYDGFKDKDDVLQQFRAPEEWQDVKILYAWYNYEDYSGSAFVLFEKKGKLYETHGSHCSCYRLEESWNPEVTTVKELSHRMEEGSYWYGAPKDELKKVLKQWKQNVAAKKRRVSKRK